MYWPGAFCGLCAALCFSADWGDDGAQFRAVSATPNLSISAHFLLERLGPMQSPVRNDEKVVLNVVSVWYGSFPRSLLTAGGKRRVVPCHGYIERIFSKLNYQLAL